MSDSASWTLVYEIVSGDHGGKRNGSAYNI